MKDYAFAIGDTVRRCTDKAVGKVVKIDPKSKIFRYLVRFGPHHIAWCMALDLTLEG